MLTEGVFKAYMDDAITGVREDLRNLHIEMLKQFHVQQVRGLLRAGASPAWGGRAWRGVLRRACCC